MASVLRTKLTAPETKPSGRSEAARPRGVAKRVCTMHAALTVRGGAPLRIQKFRAKFRQNSSHFCSFIFKISLIFSKKLSEKFTNFDENFRNNISAIFTEKSSKKKKEFKRVVKRPTFLRFSNFLRFRNETIVEFF